MFPSRLADVTAAQVQSVIEQQIAESIDVEFKRELPAKGGSVDNWMTGGKIGDEAKDQLAKEIIAFANTDGGTLIVGIGEDAATKQAIAPVRPIPNCKTAANNLYQAVVRRVEPRLPAFECEGVVTEADGTSGVLILRTLSSYLAPHRHTSDNHCYVRRNDASEPMSMSEVQNKTRQVAQSGELIERAFAASEDRLFHWIPIEHQRTHPSKGLQRVAMDEPRRWIECWALRISMIPFASLPAESLMRGDKANLLSFPRLGGSGVQGTLLNFDLSGIEPWRQRLRSIERGFRGGYFIGRDRLSAEGTFDRHIFAKFSENKADQNLFFNMRDDLMWNVASVIQFCEVIRSKVDRPSLGMALEIEILMSRGIYLAPYSGLAQRGAAISPAPRVMLPRYEIGPLDSFNELLTIIDRDVWNAAGYEPDWHIDIDWPQPLCS